GVLYVQRDRQAHLRPSTAGWMSHRGAFDFLNLGGGHLRYDRPLRDAADVFEGGNLGAASFAALEASVELIAELGVSAIFDHVQRGHDALEPERVARGFTSERAPNPAARSGILSVRPPAGVDLALLRRELLAAGIATAIPDGRLRFSPHWPNALDDAA